nr:MAG TPA: hypothetical protein [Caudoviricetes sp.]DAM85678.1 MAG TPA: hypothetical protein [Caudoviricetes sp.]
MWVTYPSAVTSLLPTNGQFFTPIYHEYIFRHPY